MTQAQDLLSKNMKRKSINEDESKGSLLWVSPSSSGTNLSESSKQKSIYLEQSQVSQTDQNSTDTVSPEKTELPLPGTSDISMTQSEITLTDQNSSPQERDQMLSFSKQSEDAGFTKPISPPPDSLCQTAPESPDDQVIISTPTTPESGSPQLDQLLSDLEELKLKFGTVDQLMSEIIDENSEVGQEFEDISSEDQCHTEDIPEEHLPNLSEEDSTTDVCKSQEELQSAILFEDSKGVTEELSAQSSQEAVQTDVVSPQTPSDLTPDETDTSARLFGFEELMEYPSPGSLEKSSDVEKSSTRDQIDEFEDLSSEDHHTEDSDNQKLNMSSAVQLSEDTHHTADTQPAHFQTSSQGEPEVISVTPDPAKSSDTSLGSCNDSPASPTDSLLTPDYPQRLCDMMDPLDSSVAEDLPQFSIYDDNITETHSSVSFPEEVTKSPSDIPEEYLANLSDEESTTDVCKSQEELQSAASFEDSKSVTEELSAQNNQDQVPDLWEATFVEAVQTDDVSSQSPLDFTPETDTSATLFGFEELMEYPSPGSLEKSSDVVKSRSSDQIDEFEDLSSEDRDNPKLSVSSAVQLSEDTHHTAGTQPAHSQTSSQGEPEVLLVTPDVAKSSDTSGPSSLGSCYDSPASPTDSLLTPDYPQRLCDMMDPLDSSVHEDLPQSSTDHENASETHSSVSFPEVAKSPSDIPEEHLANLSEEDSTTDVCKSQEELQPAASFEDSKGVTEELSAQSNRDQVPDLWEATFVEAIQTDDVSSQSLPDSTPETDASAQLFGFEELMVHPSPESLEKSPDEDKSRTSDQIDEFKDLSSEDRCHTEDGDNPKLSLSSAVQLSEDADYTVVTPFKDSEEISAQSNPDELPHSWEATFVEDIQTDDVSSQSLSDTTPETVTTARHFGFEELVECPSPGSLEKSSHSEESLTPVEYFVSQSSPVKPKAETTSSTSDEEYSIPPGYAETTTSYAHMPPKYAELAQSGADSPTFEYSDPEPYFDCKQGESDLSEPDEPEKSSRSDGDWPQDHFRHPRLRDTVNSQILLSSESEDYEDAPFLHEPLYNVNEEDEEELLQYSEASDEEFTLCEASQPPPVCETGANDDTDKTLSREIAAELGSMSESSDDEFLTTRIVRRRVVIQADEMPELPNQSVTEEKYTDENGHMVVKKVTRKIIRKCVSADGVEREEVSSEGAPQGSISTAEGDAYSKVVKRTVLKSEGDHTEVTFAECEGFSSSQQEKSEVRQVRHKERTTVVEGERSMTHQGDPTLASDLPSAQDDFKQALGYISGFNRAELPHVVESETVKEDGTVVRRAHMRKGRTHRRTVVKEAGRRKQVLLEQVDDPPKESKPRGLQQHLHQLFHRHHQEEKDNDDDEEEEEEE